MGIIESLAEPPVRFRPAPFWFLNHRLDPEEMRRQVREMHRGGYGGFFMHARMGRLTPYLSREWMEALKAAVEEAARLGMRPWFYDEDNWPSGYAGGKILELGEWTRGRFARVELHQFRDGSVAIPDGREILGAWELATRETGDPGILGRRQAVAGEIWRAEDPAADTLLLFRLELHDGEREFCPEEKVSGYIDVFNPEVTDAFIASTYAAYRDYLGPDLWRHVAGAFFDEPEYHELGLWEGPPRFPWSDSFPREYAERFHASLLDDLPLLLYDGQGAAAVRYRYYRLLSELFAENFTGRLYRWCEENGIQLTGHVILEEHPRTAVRAVGNPMHHYRRSHIPGIDHLGKEIELKAFWSDAVLLCKQAQSAAAQLGREQVMCETFAGGGFDFGLQDQKWMGDWMNALGVNLLCHHACHYSLEGYRKRDYPPTFGFQQPWFDSAARLSAHFARIGFALSRGRRRADLLVLHPMESFWATQRDDDFHGDDPLSLRFRLLVRTLQGTGYDWDLGDESYLAEMGRVVDGRLEIGVMRYGILVLPAIVRLRASTQRLIDEFIAAGGRVASPLDPADLRDLFDAVAFEGPADSIVPLDDSAEASLDEGLRKFLARFGAPQIESAVVGALDRGLVFQERLVPGEGRLLFLAHEAKDERILALRFPGVKREPQCIDTMNGGVLPDSFRRLPDGAWEVPLGGGRSHLLWFPDQEANAGMVPSFPTVLPPVAQPATLHPLDIRPLDQNNLLLDRCTLDAAGVKRELFCVEAVGDLAELSAAEPLPFSAGYRFTLPFQLEGASILAELPAGFRLSLDGRELEPAGWKFDPSLRRFVPAGVLAPGEHRIRIRGEWSPGLQIEPVFLAGDFSVRFEESGPMIGPGENRLVCGDLALQGFPFYAGGFEYRFAIDPGWSGREIEFPCRWDPVDTPKLTLNVEFPSGMPVRTLIAPPYRVRVPEECREGIMRVRLATGLRNLYGPFHVLDEREIDCLSPADQLPREGAWTAAYRSVPIGLPAPPRLI